LFLSPLKKWSIPDSKLDFLAEREKPRKSTNEGLMMFLTDVMGCDDILQLKVVCSVIQVYYMHQWDFNADV